MFTYTKLNDAYQKHTEKIFSQLLRFNLVIFQNNYFTFHFLQQEKCNNCLSDGIRIYYIFLKRSRFGYVIYMCMSTLTIPKKITKGAELVIVPREEYEEFSRWRKAVETRKTFKPTKAQLQDLEEARKEYRRGEYMTLDGLKQKLGSTG